MKTKLCCFGVLFGVLAAAVHAQPAFDEALPVRSLAPASDPLKNTDRFFLSSDMPGKAVASTPVTFLGVTADPAPVVLTEQLGLAKNVGLVVTRVMPESPAEGLLKQHDLLLKLNDQLLIELRQFSVLVQSRKEGEEVSLTLVRAGKESTVKVKLGSHTPRQMAYRFEQYAPGVPTPLTDGARLEQVASEVRKRRELRQEAMTKLGGERNLSVLPGEKPFDLDETLRRIAEKSSTWKSSNKDGVLELRSGNDKKLELIAHDTKGEIIFKGPVETSKERDGVPADVLRRLREQLSRMDRIPADLLRAPVKGHAGSSPVI